MAKDQALFLGIFVADLSFYGERIPARGETLIGQSYEIGPGGKASNQAVAAARLLGPGRVEFLGRIGRDDFGAMGREIWNESGVGTRWLQESAHERTGAAAILLGDSGENCINVVPGASGGIASLPREAFSQASYFVTQMELPEGPTLEALALAKQSNCQVVLNPAPAREIPKEVYLDLDWLIPNEVEAHQLSGERDPGRALRWFLDRGVRNCVITLGDQGFLWGNGTEVVSEAAFEGGQVLDTSGAGDAFVGALVAGLMARKAPREALLRANQAAGLSVTKRGTASSLPWAQDLHL